MRINKTFWLIIGVLVVLSFTILTVHPRYSIFKSSYDPKLDTIFLGVNFGMDKQEFFDMCLELNKQGKAVQGTHNTSVLYFDNENFKMPVDMNFYPNFFEEKIYAMPVYFNYKAWAPWNRELQSDSLILEVVTLFEKWYGKGFEKIKLPSGRIGYVKKNYPRVISVKIRDEQFVDALIENLHYVPKEYLKKDE